MKSDFNLIEKIKQRDRKAADELIKRHQSFAIKVAFRHLKNEEDAVDAAQDAFIRLFRNIDKFSYESEFTTWFYRIIQNICLDRLRQKKRRASKADSVIEHYSPASESSADKEMEILDTRSRILQIAEKLQPRQKEVFFMRDVEQLPINITAELLGISNGAVKSNLYHARKFIKRELTRLFSMEVV